MQKLNTKKVLSWFLTENGRKFSYVAAATASIGVMVAQFVPHTICLEQYKSFLHLYRKGMSVPLRDTLKKRFSKTLDLLEIHGIERPLYSAFSAYGFDVVSAGSGYSRFGVVVGLPANFAYESFSDVDRDLIKTRNGTIVWGSEEGQSLAQALVVSENAQIYGMAREICFRQTPKNFLDCLLSSTSVLLAYAFGRLINKKYNLYVHNLSVRLVVYGLIGSFVGINHFMIKDGLQLFYERKIDKQLCERNPLFVEGGKEYYSKLLQRNVALRKLMGKEGEGLWTALGNENTMLRTTHMPLVDRKLFFEEYSQANSANVS